MICRRRSGRAPRRRSPRASTWIHALLLLAFLNYLPYSKHLHVITSLPNTYFSNTSGPGQVGVMRPMDLEAEGVEHVRRVRREGPVVEEPARRLLVHRVRALHRRVSREHHRQAAESAQDRRQRTAANDGAGADARRRSGGGDVARARRGGRRRRGRLQRSAMPPPIGCSTTTSRKTSSGRARRAARASRSVRSRSISST